jgi:hypothetical protein
MRGCQAFADWVQNLHEKARRRLGCRCQNNQYIVPSLLDDISFFFQDHKEPDFTSCSPPDHGRIEIRKIWTSAELNSYLTFPHVGQIFCIGREITQKKTVKRSIEIAPTGQSPDRPCHQSGILAH